MTLRRRALLSLIVVFLMVSTSIVLKAQDAPTPEPPTATAILPTNIPPTPLPSPTDIPTPIPTDTFTPEPSLTPLPVPTEISTPEPSLTPLPLPTETTIPSPTDTFTPEPSLTPSETSTEAASLTLTTSPTVSATASETLTASPTMSLTPSVTASAQMQNQIGVIAPLANPIACNSSGPIQLASVSSSGNQVTLQSTINSISADGRYTYFSSNASNLTSDDTNNNTDIFEFDRTTCQTRRVSTGSNNEQGNGDSKAGVVSGDRNYLAFTSLASNFDVNDTNNKVDVFVKNLPTGMITRIVADPSNSISSYTVPIVSISDNGRYIAFDVVNTSQQGIPVLYDLQTNTRTVIAQEGRSLYISGNGQFIAFISSQSNLVTGDTNNIDDVFVYEVSTGLINRVSIATDGTQALNSPPFYGLIGISGDGQYVSFVSASNTLVAGDTNGQTDVFVRDRLNNQTTRVSVSTYGTENTGYSAGASMSGDGRYIAFWSSDGTLVAGDTNGVIDIFIRDRSTNQTYQVSNPNRSVSGVISADGQYLALSTDASNLIGGDTNNLSDVYVVQRSAFTPATPTPTSDPLTLTAQAANMTATNVAGETYTAQTATAIAASCVAANAAPLQLASVSITNGFADNDSSTNSLAISDTGRYVAFVSAATNLVWPDLNNLGDVFRFDRQSCQSILISKSLANVQANGGSSSVAMSTDGQIIAFASSATNLVVGDANSGIFVRNLTANTLIRIPNTGSASSMPSISGDGRYVTYTDFVNASTRNIMLYDIQMAQSKLIESVVSSVTYSKISRDGSAVFYFNSTSSLGLYSLSTQQTYPLLANVNPAAMFDVSDTGRYVVFGSDASNLVPNDTNGALDIFVLDQQTSQVTRASVSTAGIQATTQSAFPAISPDGRYVSFVSSAANLVASDTNGFSDVFVRDLMQQLTYMVSVGSNGILGNQGSGAPIAPFSGDDKYIAFVSSASNLVAGDTNLKADIFIANNLDYHPSYVATATAGAVSATARAFATQTSAAATATAAALTLSPTASRTPLPTTTLGTPVGNFPCNPSASVSIASVDSAGTQGTYTSFRPNISSTGRFVTYYSSASNLVSGDTNGKNDVFVFDRQTCQTTRASVAANGNQGNGDSKNTSVSSDGRYVTFMSVANNLTNDDADSSWDVFIKDTQTGSVIRLAAGFTDEWSNLGSPYFAGDDQTIIYRTSTAISLYNIQTQQQTVLVTAPDLSLDRNPISNDLRYVVFSSASNSIVPNDTNNALDVFLLDRQTNQIIRISVSSNGIEGNGHSNNAAISADGRYAVFNSYATNLAGTNAVPGMEVFVRDLQNLVTYQVSLTNDGSEGNGSSGYGSISDDGRYVAFLSESTNLVSDDNNNQDDVFVRDRQTNQTHIISRIPAGSLGNNQSDRPTMSRDGSYIAFASGASNLVTGDTNGVWDVFVAQRAAFDSTIATPTPVQHPPTATSTFSATPQPTGTYGAGNQVCNPTGTMVTASVNSSGLQGLGDSKQPSISADGRYIVFTSTANNLIPNDTATNIDIFRFDRQTCITIRVSEAPDGTQANGDSANPVVSGDGRFVAFDSLANNLVQVQGS